MRLLSSERALRITPRSLSRGKKLLKGYVEVIVSNIDFHFNSLELYKLCFALFTAFLYVFADVSIHLFNYFTIFVAISKEMKSPSRL